MWSCRFNLQDLEVCRAAWWDVAFKPGTRGINGSSALIMRWAIGSLALPTFTLSTFHFSSILPDARLEEFSQATDSVLPGRPTRIVRGLFEAVRSLYECGFVRGDFSQRQI
jgi:hypothetical protein